MKDEEFEVFCAGARYTLDDFENAWDLDFDDEPELIAGLEACADINTNLCETCTIAKLHCGGWLSYWTERHPEMLTYDELFAHDGERRHAEFTNSRLRELEKLEALMPSTINAKSITRAQAFTAIATIWLPREFHVDLNLPF